MNERLLQFIWQFQYFNKNELATTSDEKLSIVKPGYYNTNQGPDFLEARVKIGRHSWAGSVELHVNASDWKKHSHSSDKNYNNVILHVVWCDDDEFPAHQIPTLVLADRVSKILLQRYDFWMRNGSCIPCGKYLSYPEKITLVSWKERLLVERLERKYQQIKLMLEQNNYNWDETTWWLVARYFGLTVNADAFEELARAVPFEILNETKKDKEKLERFLFETAASLNTPLHFLRMRPAAFPDVRLKQLAECIASRDELFKPLLKFESIRQLKAVFPTAVIINAILPVLFAHGKIYGMDEQVTRAIDFFHAVAKEKNNITKEFEKLGVENKTAADSQSLIELKTNYCNRLRCLDCAIGSSILKKNI